MPNEKVITVFTSTLFITEIPDKITIEFGIEYFTLTLVCIYPVKSWPYVKLKSHFFKKDTKHLYLA
jgi:hypothetical protein